MIEKFNEFDPFREESHKEIFIFLSRNNLTFKIYVISGILNGDIIESPKNGFLEKYRGDKFIRLNNIKDYETVNRIRNSGDVLILDLETKKEDLLLIADIIFKNMRRKYDEIITKKIDDLKVLYTNKHNKIIYDYD